MLVSIAIPIYDMPNKDFFLKRCLDSIREQTYTNYEIVITEKGKMAENTNAAIKESTGDIIKIMYMDDYFAHPDALKRIVEAFNGNWLVTGCMHDSQDNPDLFNPHFATYNDQIHTGANTIGSPSVVTIKNGLDIYFDEEMTWLLDCDFYKRINDKYGAPVILDNINVIIGVGDHQMTHLMGDEVKYNEHEYMLKKYENN